MAASEIFDQILEIIKTHRPRISVLFDKRPSVPVDQNLEPKEKGGGIRESENVFGMGAFVYRSPTTKTQERSILWDRIGELLREAL